MLGVLDSRAQHTRVYPSRRACTGARAQCTRNATLCPPTNTPRDSDTRTSPFLPCAPSICTHLRSLTLPQNTPAGGREGRRGGERRGECARTCRHAHTLAHTHTLSHAPPAPLDVPSPPRPRRAERGGTRQWQMTAAPRCAPPPRASLSSPFFSLMPPPHAPRQADRAPSQAAGLSPFFLFLFFASSTPSHPDTIGRPPSRGRSSSRCK